LLYSPSEAGAKTVADCRNKNWFGKRIYDSWTDVSNCKVNKA